jgi:hypothetical protein
MPQEERLSSEFLFTCDGHDHDHDLEGHDGTLPMPLEYVTANLIREIAVITGHISFSEDAIDGIKDMQDYEVQGDVPIATMHITAADGGVKVWFLDRGEALNISGMLLEWVTRIDKEDEDG